MNFMYVMEIISLIPQLNLNSQSSFIEVLSDLEKETKLEDTTLSPGQTINGSVVFQVNSLYNKSFLLMYNETPITSASFEKSIEALSTAERYNYSIIFGIPPYNYGFNDSFEYSEPNGFSNWVNRSIFEVFNKADTEFSIRMFPYIWRIRLQSLYPRQNLSMH